MSNRLHRMLIANKAAPGRRFEVKAAASGSDEAEVYLYDAIVDDELDAEYYGGVAPQSFVKAFRAITAGTIHLRINSPGGSVFAARAIETAIREHPAKCIVHIDGLAASAATFVAMAGDEVRMSPGAMFMIHKAWTLAFGNAEDLRKTCDLLDKIDGTLAETYAKKTGMDPQKCADMMAAETWMTAAEALDAGFVDSVTDPDEDGDSKKKDPDGPDDHAARTFAGWDLSVFDRAPKIIPAPAAKAAEHPVTEQATTIDAAAYLRRLEAAALIP